MTRDEIFAEIAELARDKLEYAGELHPEMRLVEDLELDSIRLLTLAMEVEDRFEVRLDEADEEGIGTVADLVGVVECKLEERALDGETVDEKAVGEKTVGEKAVGEEDARAG